MPIKYLHRDELGKTMHVFEKNGKLCSHVIKVKTDKTPAKFIFETQKYESVDQLKSDYSEPAE